PNFKQAIVDSDGHDTQLSEIPDLAAGLVWPGAMTRSRRNRFVERWAGREWALRQDRAEALARLQAARKAGDVEEGPLSMGQAAGARRLIGLRRGYRGASGHDQLFCARHRLARSFSADVAPADSAIAAAWANPTCAT